MSIKLLSTSGGSVTIQEPNTASDFTLSVPAQNGSVVTSDASGNVGIGTASPSSFYSEARNLVVGTGSGGQGITIYAGTASQSRLMFADGTSGSDPYTGFVQYDHSSNALTFGTNGGNERMRIASDGTAMFRSTGGTAPWDATSGTFAWVGQSTYPVGLTAEGNICAIMNRNTDVGSIVEFKYNGSFKGNITTNGSTISYNTSSDYRLKENIAPMTGALAKVAQLKPCSYTWKETGIQSQGFIAHELAEVVPDAVVGEKDAIDAEGNPVYQGIDTSFLVATLTAAIQEQQAIIAQLQADVAELKGKLA